MYRYQEMKGIFHMMNYNDSNKTFSREIQLFDTLIKQLKENESHIIIN